MQQTQLDIHLHTPYPAVHAEGPNMQYARIMLDNIGGGNSEMSSVSLYMYNSLAAEEPAIKFCKVNVDDEPGLAAQFGVSSIPTLIFSKNGALTGRTVGFRPKAELLELIDGIKD